MSNIEIKTKDKSVAIKTTHDVITDHIPKLINGVYDTISHADVTPLPPVRIVPSVIALYDDDTEVNVSRAERNRGKLLGWAACGYDYSDTTQAVIGSRQVTQYKVEPQEDGFIKHRFVVEFGPGQAVGDITKVRVYGSTLPLTTGTQGTDGYLNLTQRYACPIIPVGGFRVKCTRSAVFGWKGETTTGYTALRDFTQIVTVFNYQRSLKVCGEYIGGLSGEKIIDGKTFTTYSVNKLGGVTSLDFMPLDKFGLHVGEVDIEGDMEDMRDHSCQTIDGDGNVYITESELNRMNRIHIYKHDVADQYKTVTKVTCDLTGISKVLNGYVFKDGGESNIAVHKGNVFIVRKHQKNTLVIKASPVDGAVLNWQFFGEDINYYLGSEMKGGFVLFHDIFVVDVDGDERVHLATTVPSLGNGHNLISCPTIAALSLKGAVIGNGREFYSNVAGCAESTYDARYTKSLTNTALDGTQVYPLSYDPVRNAMAFFAYPGAIGFVPVSTTGRDCILAESRLPVFTKTKDQVITVSFDYMVKTEF